MKTMTSRERMMTALQNKQPDRIPVAPDISNMIPCRLTGKPFWEIYVNNNPPLWKAYLDAVRYFGIDGWFIYGEVGYKTNPPLDVSTQVKKSDNGFWEVRNTYHTPAGDLTEIIANPAVNPPTRIEKLIKNFKEDFEKYKYLFPEITGYDDSIFKEQKKELGELGMMGFDINPPGLFFYTEFFNGSLEAATYAYFDYPDLFEELRQIHEKHALRQVEIAIEIGADSILTGGSGAITLQSPDIWNELSLPTLKKIIKMCKEAGVISGIHTCGKELHVLETCANETVLDYINPLEIPPMGDCNLKECKEKFGDKIALMGNLHTSDVMLQGSPEDVTLESLKAILYAGANGGFVLSTGDQCGRDTPDKNIFAMVEAVNKYGNYPLDFDKIAEEIKRLEKYKK